MPTCSVSNCTYKGSEDFYNATNSISLCPNHRDFMKGLKDLPDNGNLLSPCPGNCGKLKFYNLQKCVTCNPKSLPVTDENLQALYKAVMYLQKESKTHKMTTGEFMGYLHYSMAAGIDLNELLPIVKDNPDKLFELHKSGASKAKRKPTKDTFKEELKETAVSIGTDKLIQGFLHVLPASLKKMGADAKTADAVKEFLSTPVGQVLILSAASGTTTFAKIPEKFEDITALVAKQTRMKAMHVAGTASVDGAVSFIQHLVSPNAIETPQEVEKPVEVSVEKTVEVEQFVNA